MKPSPAFTQGVLTGAIVGLPVGLMAGLFGGPAAGLTIVAALQVVGTGWLLWVEIAKRRNP